MGKWRRQPRLTPEQLPSEIRQVEREIEQVAEAIAREEAVLAQEYGVPVPPHIPLTTPPAVPIPIAPLPEPLPEKCKERQSRFYVMDLANTLYVIDPETEAVLKTVHIGDEYNKGIYMIYDEAHERIYLSGTQGTPGVDQIYVFDVNSESVITTIDVGINPIITGIDKVRNILYVPSGNYDDAASGYLSVVDLNTDTVVATIDVASHLQFAWVEPGTGEVYMVAYDFANQVQIWHMDPDTYQTTLVAETNMFTQGWSFAAPDFAHGKIYTTGEGDSGTHLFAAIDMHTGAIESRVMPDTYWVLYADPYTGNILAISYEAIALIDPTTYAPTVLATASAGEMYSPFQIIPNVVGDTLYALTVSGQIYGYNLETGAEVYQMTIDGIDVDTNPTVDFVAVSKCIAWD